MSEQGDGKGALAGRHAVVTGGGTGIGRAVAERLAREGARLTLMGRRRDKLEEAAAAMAGARAIACDVTVPASVVAAFDEAARRGGAVHILVNSAGAAHSAPLARMTPAEFTAMLEVNLVGVFLCCQAALPGMLAAGEGRIVTIASTAGLKGYPYVAGYCAAKHGVIGLTRSLALEVAGKGITVNAVCPGYTDTDMVAGALEAIVAKTGRDRDETLAELTRGSLLGRLIEPDEVAAAVAWLCDPGSAAVTGQAITIAGGEVT